MMTMKTYQAPTMADALAEVKKELGRDALILNTRRKRTGGLLGWFGGESFWQVQAAPSGYEPPPDVAGRYIAGLAIEYGDSEPMPAPLELKPDDPDYDLFCEPDREADVCEPTVADDPAPVAIADSAATQMQEIHKMVSTLFGRHAEPTQSPAGEADLPPQLLALKEHLLEQDVEKSIASELMQQLQDSLANQPALDDGALRARLTDLIADRITIAPSRTTANGQRIIALIGPTGVGKTTTVAKLAANFRLREHKKVALITIDTYRIAAVDQLRTYAEIIEVPIKAVFTPGELHSAVRQFSQVDVILIDTAGRSQNDELRLEDLRKFLDAVGCTEVHLVLSAAGNPRVARSALKRFGPIGANRILVTKLDEAETFGMILNLASATDAGVSCVTTGQDVPDDIAPADASRLAECIMFGSWNEK